MMGKLINSRHSHCLLCLLPLFFTACFSPNNDIAQEEDSSSNSEKVHTLDGDHKFHVSKAEAKEKLQQIKRAGNTKRPSLDEIAFFNGGTAQDEIGDPRQPCWADEGQFQNIERQVLNKWEKGWRENNFSAIKELTSPKKFNNHFLRKEQASPDKEFDDIKLYKWAQFEGDFLPLEDYFAQFQQVEDFNISVFQYISPNKFRDAQLNMKKVKLHAHYDIRGISQSGLRRNDRGPVEITLTKEDQSWKITELKSWDIQTLVKEEPAFREVTSVSGVDNIPSYLRVEAIRRGGYAIAMGDYNGDGIQDMYVGAHGPGKLLKGNKDGTFSVVKNSGLGENDTAVKTAIFSDFNNDGHQDLLLVRFLPSETKEVVRLYRNDILLYKNTGKGKFERIENPIQDGEASGYPMPAAVADFNEDGLLDFYVGYPGAKDFTTFGKVPDREGFHAQGLYLNQGNFKFSENHVGEHDRLDYSDKTSTQKIYPHSSVALDFDQDGDMDIMVIDDRGNISPAYQNDGTGKFVQAQKHLGIESKGHGMGMAAADINNNGQLEIALSNVNFSERLRFDQSCIANWDDNHKNDLNHGLKHYMSLQKGEFTDATMKNGLSYAGEGLAGIEFLDYNNDGHQDLYVANGLWTGTSREQDLGNHYVQSQLVYQSDDVLETVNRQSQSVVMEVLSGFVGDIFEDQKQIEERPHLAGFQRNRLFRNMGDGTFVEVGYLEGVDSIADGYVISKADIDSDQDLDLILRNADPGSKEVNFPPVQVFENKFSKNNSIRLKLIGKEANKDAIGSQVKLFTEEEQQYQQLIANNGTAQSEKILHFGIGTADKATKVEIIWPNGKKQIIEGLPKGFHKIHQNSKNKYSLNQ